MKSLYINDLFLALGDLLEDRPDNQRLKPFEASITSQLYKPILQTHWDELKKLPAELTGRRPFADELGQFDILHDGFGGAFFEMMSAYLRIPTLSAERRSKVETLLQEFAGGGLSELKASYPDEAALARERQPKLATFEATLKEFPLADKGTAYDLVSEQIRCGLALDQKMSARASEEANQSEKSRSSAGRLRGTIIGTLSRCRTALADELKMREELPRHLDALVFGYFDELDTKRTEANRLAQEKEKASKEPKEQPPQKAES